MAKINQGILGGFSGSVANVVGSSWKGIAVMKAKPLSVSNPKTAAQVAQRNKFKAGSELSTRVKVAITKPFWDRFASKMSGTNAWMSENVQHYDAAGIPDLPALVMSKGAIGAEVLTDFTYNALTQISTVNWDKVSAPSNSALTDTCACVIVGPDNVVYGIREAGVITRDDETIDITNDTGLAMPAGSYAYLVFMRPDGTVVSNTAKIVLT